VLIFVAMGGDQIRAINRTVDVTSRSLPQQMAQIGSPIAGQKARWFSFFTDRAGHGKQNTPCAPKKQKGRGGMWVDYPGGGKPYPHRMCVARGRSL